MENLLKKKIRDSKHVVGTMFQLGCATAVECLGISGLDFFIIDAEHAPVGTEDTRRFVMASELRGITPLVRIKSITRDVIRNALDLGAGGLVAPGIQTADEVREIILHAKYPPDGTRGFCYTRSSAFGYDEIAEDPKLYFKTCNSETLIIPQCETKECVANIDEVVSVPGVDGIFIGPYDLSLSLGCVADFDSPIFIAAVEKVLTACRTAKKFVITLSVSAEHSRHCLDSGYAGIVFNSDVDMLIRAYRCVVEQLSGSLPAVDIDPENTQKTTEDIGYIPQKGDIFGSYISELYGQRR